MNNKFQSKTEALRDYSIIVKKESGQDSRARYCRVIKDCFVLYQDKVVSIHPSKAEAKNWITKRVKGLIE